MKARGVADVRDLISHLTEQAKDHLITARQLRKYGHGTSPEYRWHVQVAAGRRERIMNLRVVYLGLGR